MKTPGLAPLLQEPAIVVEEEDEGGIIKAAVAKAAALGDKGEIATDIGGPTFGHGRRNSLLSLDQSLDSLNFFRLRQSGRLAATTEGAGSSPQIGRRRVSSARSGANADQPRGTLAILPRGTVLEIEVLSTWGDVKYVGLNGVQLFADTGQEVTSFRSVEVDPEDEHNIIPAEDPRVVGNLVNGVYRTMDLLHMWLAPFRRGTRLIVTLTLFRPVTVAMIRVWNYNESRVYTDRGVRDVQIRLDGKRIFHGEIGMASGHTRPQGEHSFGEVILFTADESMLAAVAENDSAFFDASGEAEMRSSTLALPATLQRPSTGGRSPEDGDVELAVMEDTLDTDDLSSIRPESGRGWKAEVLQLSFEETWGDRHYLGLTGISVVAADGSDIPLQLAGLDASPRDLNELPNVSGDLRTLDKLIDGDNVTTEDTHMWMIPYRHGGDHLLTINLGRSRELLGLRVWNYNKSQNDTTRGAKRVRVLLDDHDISPPQGYLLRRAPGHALFDYCQELQFDVQQQLCESDGDVGQELSAKGRPNPLQQLVPDYVCALDPTVLMLTVRILASCGDPFYVGLNGIQVLGYEGEPIRIDPGRINAIPHSINVLPDHSGDLRTPDKLLDGVNETFDDRHMWLAPIIPGQPNIIEIYFDSPQTLSAVQFWNYSKTSSRGIRRFQILADGAIIYDGHLNPAAPPPAAGIAPWSTTEQVDSHQTVMFTRNKGIVEAEAKRLVPFCTRERDVGLINEGELLLDGEDNGQAQPVGIRPKTRSEHACAFWVSGHASAFWVW